MIAKSCIECGKDFEVDDTKRNWQSKKLCSPECQRANTNKQARLKYKPIEWPQKKTCIRCGAGFLVHESGNMAQKYCNAECQLAAKAEKKAAEVEARRQPKKCEHCGAAFVSGKFSAHKQRYCSTECRSQARHKQQYVDGRCRAKIRNGYRYDFKQIRPQILDRDDGKCVVCGSAENVHVHHWDNSGGTLQVNNDPANLATMCGVCHYAIHGVTLVRIDGQWMLDSKIFELLGLTGAIPIKP
jgi:5-methylcytosine-specific restriction endonuclease McrA